MLMVAFKNGFEKGGRSMNEMTFKRNELLAQQVIKGLVSRNMSGYYAASREALPNLVEILIPHHFSRLIGHDVVGLELIEGTETVLVHKFHDGVEFLQAVFQGCAGEDDGVMCLDAPGGLRDLGVPVLQPLHLIHDEQVCLQLAQYLYVITCAVVGYNLVWHVKLVLGDAFVVKSLDDMHAAP